MSSPRTIPSQGAKDVVTTTVRIDGADIPKTFEVAGISVFKGIGRIPFARIEILDGDPAGQSFPASESALFAPGKTVEILAGYHSQEDVIFKGTLVGQKIRIRKSGRGLLTLLCRHPLYQSTLTRRCRTWKDMTDADCIGANFKEYGVTTVCENTERPDELDPDAVRISPNPWEKSVATDEIRCSKDATFCPSVRTRKR